MKRSLLTLALLAALPTFAQDFDLTDMTPARPGESVESADVVTKGNVVVGKDEKTAVKAAHQQLVDENQDGIRLVQVGSGTGILSIGSSSYNTYDNMNATLLSKRGAYNQAALIAKKQLIENMNGIEQLCENAVQTSMDVIDTGSDSVANESTAMMENCAESVSGSLSGYVTFDVYDDIDSKSVRVSLISTPKTRAQIRDSHGAVAVTTDPNEVFKQVVADINSGVLPPMGAKILTHADTGEVILMGYGSAIIRDNSNDRVARRLKDAAKRQSQTRARSALLGTMQGDEVYWKGSFSEDQVESTQQFEYGGDPRLEDPTTAKKLDSERTVFLNQLKMSDEYGAVTKGQLPPGVSNRSFASEDGHWMYTVSVYSPSLEAVSREAKREMEAGGTANPSSSGRNIRVYGGQNDEAANPQGASGKVSDEDNL